MTITYNELRMEMYTAIASQWLTFDAAKNAAKRFLEHEDTKCSDIEGACPNHDIFIKMINEEIENDKSSHHSVY